MGAVIRTISCHATNPGAGGAAAVVAAGDSLTVATVQGNAPVRLEQVIRAGAAAGYVQITSTRLHDDTRGIRVISNDEITRFSLPRETGQPLVPGDTLAVSISGGTAETDVAALVCYYDNMSGANSRLASWGDISGLIKAIKPLEVNVTSAATIGEWSDTVITATEDLLHAGSDYAVLGFLVDAAFAVVGIKGSQVTASERVCAGVDKSGEDTADVFVRLSDATGRPHIPVLNADNKSGTRVSVLADTASLAGNVSLILAELSSPFGG